MVEFEDVKKRILEYLSRNGERSTGEVAIALGENREVVRYCLTRLALDGLVKRRKVTPKVHMWQLTEEGRKTVTKTQ